MRRSSGQLLRDDSSRATLLSGEKVRASRPLREAVLTARDWCRGQNGAGDLEKGG